MSNPIDVIVGANLRAKRVLAGMSQEQLGASVGLTFQQIQKYEKGQNRVSASRLVELSVALGCQLLDLFEGVSEASQQIKNRTIEQLRFERKVVEGYNGLPPEIQRALCNLMEAMTISVAHHLRVTP